VLGLIPFRAASVFTTGSGDYVKNAETRPVLDGLAAFVTLWALRVVDRPAQFLAVLQALLLDWAPAATLPLIG
jgi:hypothetical protein